MMRGIRQFFNSQSHLVLMSGLMLGISSGMTSPSLAATQIVLNSGLDPISLDELEAFANSEALPPAFSNLPPSEQEKIRESQTKLKAGLNRAISIDLNSVDTLSISSLSQKNRELVLALFPGITDQQLRETAIAIAQRGNGQSVMDFLRGFPSKTIEPENFVDTVVDYAVERTISNRLVGEKIFAGTENISVQTLPSTAGFTSDLRLFSPRSQFISTNRNAGHVVNLGTFAPGQELLFGIFVRDTGNTFLMGSGLRNADGLPHARVNFLSPGVIDVGFEDTFGGGDFDFDDNVFRFRGINLAPSITGLTPSLTIPQSQPFNFYAIAEDLEGGDLTYEWDLDSDGNFDDFVGSNGQHVFSRGGIFSVKVRVTDNAGAQVARSLRVEVVPEPSNILGLLAITSFGLFPLSRRCWQRTRN